MNKRIAKADAKQQSRVTRASVNPKAIVSSKKAINRVTTAEENAVIEQGKETRKQKGLSRETIASIIVEEIKEEIEI